MQRDGETYSRAIRGAIGESMGAIRTHAEEAHCEHGHSGQGHPAGLGGLDDYFQLGVNFGPAVVNRHRIELFVLDATGGIASIFARLQWDVDAVLQCARAVSDGPDVEVGYPMRSSVRIDDAFLRV